MIPEQFALPLVDFIREANRIPNLIAAILFGSAVKGEFHKKSDIDILLLFESRGNPEVGQEAKVAHQVASDISKKHSLQHSFSFVMHNISRVQDADVEFLRNVCKEGVVIWGRPDFDIMRKPHPSLKPKDLFSYSMRDLKPRDKMAAHRALYGYRVEKTVKGRRYVNEAKGLIDQHGERLVDGVVIVDPRISDRIIELFDSHAVQYRRLKIWV
jgi:predicted nucleotidyltransferase